MYIGKEALLQEAIEDLVPELYREAAKQAEIDPVAQAQIDIVDFGDGKPLTFTAEVDVKPDVTLGEYKGLAVEKRIRKITDEDVDAMLERSVKARHNLLRLRRKPSKKATSRSSISTDSSTTSRSKAAPAAAKLSR